MNIKCNSDVALQFYQGMMSYRKTAAKHAAMLEKFSAWHLHDGWVRVNYKSGKQVTQSPIISILWYLNRAGSAHSSKPPKKGDQVIIIDSLPLEEKDHVTPFTVYSYRVISIDCETYKHLGMPADPEYKLGREKEMQICYNPLTECYEEYINPSLKNKFLLKLQKFLSSRHVFL